MSKNNLKLAIEIENKVSNLGEAEQHIDSLDQMGIGGNICENGQSNL